MKEIDELKLRFLSPDLDEDELVENRDRINEWQKSITANEDFLSWQEHDVTKKILQEAKQSYKDISMSLMTARSHDDKERSSLYGKQDACLFLIEMIEKDAKSALEQVHKEIRAALNA